MPISALRELNALSVAPAVPEGCHRPRRHETLAWVSNFDTDRVFGGDRGDKLLVNDGDGRDVVKGGAGRDVCLVDPGDRAVNCEVTRDDQGGEGTRIAEDKGLDLYK